MGSTHGQPHDSCKQEAPHWTTFTWPFVKRWTFRGEKSYSATSPDLLAGLVRYMLLTTSSWRCRGKW